MRDLILNKIKPYRKILNNYIYASKLFNAKYKNHYKIRVFIDFNFLNIYLDNLQSNKGTKVQILYSEINDLSPEEILKAYRTKCKEILKLIENESEVK